MGARLKKVLSSAASGIGSFFRFLMPSPQLLWGGAVLALIVVGIMAWMGYKSKDDFLSLGVSDTIDNTPAVVESMREIGQWEFLSISDEELIDTVRTGFFSDDELIRIYYGTLRLGIDFSQCNEEWIEIKGDSIILDLPEVQLLDNSFLDETRTRSFFESGSWSNSDRKALAERARQAMRTRCLTPQNLSLAQRNADQQVRAFIKNILGKASPHPLP